MRVSVIIPTLNEASCLAGTLEQLRTEGVEEIIVSDGGSQDRTVSIAGHFARVVQSAPGRAMQQNLGASAASGDVLLFLHADCSPASGWLAAVERTVRRRDFVAGCFQMRIDSRRWAYRMIERGVELRVLCLGLPYGDQGIFLRRETFYQLGGFPQVNLMEDLLLVRRLRRHGRVHMLRHPIYISPRRWERIGLVQQTLRNWGLAVAFWGGVHPDRLSRFYPAAR